MTEPVPAKPGEPCWIDLLSSDTDAAERFYGELFGWTAESAGPEYGGYINFSLDGTRVAGMMGLTPEMGPMPDAWSIYLASTDTRATLDAAAANGGGVMMAATDILLIGVMGYATDPGGAAVGVFQATGDTRLRLRPADGRGARLVRAVHEGLRADRQRGTSRRSAGRRAPRGTRTSSGNDARRRRRPAGRRDGRQRVPPARRAGALVGLLPSRRHRRHGRGGDEARRQGRHAARGHAVREAGHADRPERCRVQAPPGSLIGGERTA